MFSLKRVVTSCIVGFLLLCSLAYTALFTVKGKTSASQSNTDPQVLQSLLTEVRELRLALERSNLTTFRTLVLLETRRLQMQRIENLRESLNRTRDELANEKSSRLSMVDRIKELEGQISGERDELKRAQLNVDQIELKDALVQAGNREEQQQEKENRLSVELQDAQTKLDEMNYKLETMERKLEETENRTRQNKR
jgi:chromosome segregation ATPase